jgi:hypothetical protein
MLKKVAHLLMAASISGGVRGVAHRILMALLQKPFSMSVTLGKVARIVP